MVENTDFILCDERGIRWSRFTEQFHWLCSNRVDEVVSIPYISRLLRNKHFDYYTNFRKNVEKRLGGNPSPSWSWEHLRLNLTDIKTVYESGGNSGYTDKGSVFCGAGNILVERRTYETNMKLPGPTKRLSLPKRALSSGRSARRLVCQISDNLPMHSTRASTQHARKWFQQVQGGFSRARTDHLWLWQEPSHDGCRKGIFWSGEKIWLI